MERILFEMAAWIAASKIQDRKRSDWKGKKEKMEETMDQADKKQSAAALYKKELLGQAGKVKRSAAVAGTTLLRQTTGFFKLPWSRLPAQGWLVLGIVFLMCAAGFALCLLQNTGWQKGL